MPDFSLEIALPVCYSDDNNGGRIGAAPW